MTNKLVFMDIIRIFSYFNGEFPYWLGMGIENVWLFQLGIEMDMGMY